MTGMEAKVAELASKVASESAKQGASQAVTQPGAESPFMELLQQYEPKLSGANAEILQAFGYEPNAHPADNAVSAEQLDIKVDATQELDFEQPGGKIATLMSHWNSGNLQMRDIVAKATSGTRFSNGEMILMQAAMHRLTLQAELAVKAVDAVRNALTTIIQRSGQ